ncbi:MAG: peptidylprolyl isomerase [bacterium]|nr:peptidylprolyl isomerase [bacterium]
MIIIETDKGNIDLEMDKKAAPKTVENFIRLVEEGFYNGTKFHRVVENFIIQGGDPLSKDDNPDNDGTGGPGYSFEDEINPKSIGVPDETIKQLEAAGYTYNYNLNSLPNSVGAISMANSGPNTNGSQFFIITTEDQAHLNGLHTVFGRVVRGMDVVLQIKQGDIINKITIN